MSTNIFLQPDVKLICNGVYVVPRFMQDVLDEDPRVAFKHFTSIPELGSDEKIVRGMCPHRIPGNHPALSYRGHAIRRHKIWAQSQLDEGLLKYGYTGWQWAIAPATVDVTALPFLDRIQKKLQKHVGGQSHNHWILTLYKDGTDNIGAHHDKMHDIAKDSWIVVLKLGGAARRFEFYDPDETKVIWSEWLEPGAAIFMNADGNARVKHGVPADPEVNEPSGSLVSRCITTRIPWRDVKKKTSTSDVMRMKRGAQKRLREEERMVKNP
jgi:hypothetical protein